MSRLDSAILRLTAQRACIDRAAILIHDLPGPVLEFGLGNGRTYDHLRVRLPDREIFVFEREVAAHPDCIPDDAHLILGDFRDTVEGALARLPDPAALAHCDIGSGNVAASRALGAWLAEPLARLLKPGAIVICDQPLPIPGAEPLAMPDDLPAGRLTFLRMPR